MRNGDSGGSIHHLSLDNRKEKLTMNIRGHHYVIGGLVLVAFYFGWKHYKATGKLY